MALSKSERVMAKVQFGGAARMDFYKQLAALLRAGMAKTDAVYMAWQVASHEGAKPKEGIALILADVINSMKDGKTFGQALKPWAPRDDIMIMEAIENSNDFAGNLLDYCEMAEKKAKIKGTVMGGLAYPFALILAMYGMALYFGKSVIPQIAEILPTEEWTGGAMFLVFMADFANYYASKTAIGIVIVVLIIAIALPRWAKTGRSTADRFPVFSTYRMYTGIGFLMSVAALMQGGESTMAAVDRLRPNANGYVGHRLNLVRRRMLNGDNFGAALHRAGTGWPDAKMNLSIKIFAETQDLSTQLSILAKGWIDESQASIKKSMGLVATLCMAGVFLMVLGTVGGIYAVQGQITEALQSGG